MEPSKPEAFQVKEDTELVTGEFLTSLVCHPWLSNSNKGELWLQLERVYFPIS